MFWTLYIFSDVFWLFSLEKRAFCVNTQRRLDHRGSWDAFFAVSCFILLVTVVFWHKMACPFLLSLLNLRGRCPVVWVQCAVLICISTDPILFGNNKMKYINHCPLLFELCSVMFQYEPNEKRSGYSEILTHIPLMLSEPPNIGKQVFFFSFSVYGRYIFNLAEYTCVCFNQLQYVERFFFPRWLVLSVFSLFYRRRMFIIGHIKERSIEKRRKWGCINKNTAATLVV